MKKKSNIPQDNNPNFLREQAAAITPHELQEQMERTYISHHAEGLRLLDEQRNRIVAATDINDIVACIKEIPNIRAKYPQIRKSIDSLRFHHALGDGLISQLSQMIALAIESEIPEHIWLKRHIFTSMIPFITGESDEDFFDSPIRAQKLLDELPERITPLHEARPYITFFYQELLSDSNRMDDFQRVLYNDEADEFEECLVRVNKYLAANEDSFDFLEVFSLMAFQIRESLLEQLFIRMQAGEAISVAERLRLQLYNDLKTAIDGLTAEGVQ